MLTEELASALARVALANGERQTPRAIAHVLSAAHLHWLLARVLRLYPMLPENGRIAALLDAHLSAANLEMELEPLAEPPVTADGLCLSRAWCFNALGLPDPAEKHFAAAMPQVVRSDDAGEYRLASFAVLALSGAALKTP